MMMWKWLVVVAIVVFGAGDVIDGLHCYACQGLVDNNCDNFESVKARNLTVECNSSSNDNNGGNLTTWCFKTHHINPDTGKVMVDRQCAVWDQWLKTHLNMEPEDAPLTGGMPYNGAGVDGMMYFCKDELCNASSHLSAPTSTTLYIAVSLMALVTAYLAK